MPEPQQQQQQGLKLELSLVAAPHMLLAGQTHGCGPCGRVSIALPGPAAGVAGAADAASSAAVSAYDDLSPAAAAAAAAAYAVREGASHAAAGGDGDALDLFPLLRFLPVLASGSEAALA